MDDWKTPSRQKLDVLAMLPASNVADFHKSEAVEIVDGVEVVVGASPRLGAGDDEGDDDDEDDDDEEEQLPRATEADEDNVWSAVRGAGEEGVEFVKTAIPAYREELSSDAARALPGEGEHC